MQALMVSMRVAAATMLICVVGYTLVVFGIAQLLVPATAQGSLLTSASGTTLGSRLIAQKFEQPRYVWPRPSAVDYNASGAGGSNKSPTNTELTERAKKALEAHGATAERPLPADLAAASGAGLDPHITLHAALYQADRVAAARKVSRETVAALINKRAFSPGGPFAPDRLVNVLELNLALDQQLSHTANQEAEVHHE